MNYVDLARVSLITAAHFVLLSQLETLKLDD